MALRSLQDFLNSISMDLAVPYSNLDYWNLENEHWLYSLQLPSNSGGLCFCSRLWLLALALVSGPQLWLSRASLGLYVPL